MAADADSTVNFTYVVPQDENNAKADVKVELLLGGLGSDIDVEFVKAEANHEEDVTHGINLIGKKEIELNGNSIIGRFDSAGGRDNLKGTAKAGDDGKSATLEITDACNDMWAGGMFIDTSVRLQAGKEYKVSFDVDVQTEGDFEVILQNKQWDETKYLTEQFNNGKTDNAGHKELAFTPTAANADGLWLYVQSGAAVNTITIFNLTVTAYENVYEKFARFKDYSFSYGVQHIEMLGDIINMHGTVGDAKVISKTSSEFSVKIGDNITVAVDTAHTRFFNATTMKAINEDYNEYEEVEITQKQDEDNVVIIQQKKGLFGRLFDKIKGLFKKKDKEETKENKDAEQTKPSDNKPTENSQ